VRGRPALLSGHTAPVTVLRARDRVLDLSERPLIMGILNASPDSFSDPGEATLDERVARAEQLLADGADLLDVGGQSNVTDRPAIDPHEEIALVVPLVERLTRDLGAIVSVDTYKAAVAEAAIAAGAHMINDISGLADPKLADLCAQTDAALVLMHTPLPPKTQSFDGGRYDAVAEDVASFLADRIDVARERGVAADRLVLDPGPDFGKTPAQTVEALRGLDRLHALGLPILLAVSRKDFVGAIVERRPRERLAGTLAAVAAGVDAGAHILRVHDVREVADHLAVRAVLRGERVLDPATRLPEGVRREPGR
jgi:dihydropteroate synthase